MNKKIKILTIVLPIILFLFIAFFLYADFMAHFEGLVYEESVEHMSPALTAIVKLITAMGSREFVILICFTLFAVPYLRKRYALPISAAVILSLLLNLLFKSIFARSRPDILMLAQETSYSFPSGHSMVSMTLYGAFVLLAWKHMDDRYAKVIVSLICAALIGAIGFSRIYLGVHYVTDVVGGWCLGLAIACSVVYRYERIVKTRIR